MRIGKSAPIVALVTSGEKPAPDGGREGDELRARRTGSKVGGSNQSIGKVSLNASFLEMGFWARPGLGLLPTSYFSQG